MRQGKKVVFAGGELILHPLTLGQLQDLEEDLAKMKSINRDTAMNKEATQRLVRVLAAAAKKAQPNITPEAILAMIDLQDVNDGTIGDAVRTLMGSSGLVQAVEGANSADPPSPRTGGDSTQDSVPH